MAIHKLEVSGFRSLKEISWEPGRLNVVIGPNGSGKSNLLRALALLQQAGSGDLPAAILRQGGIGPVLWDGSSTQLSWKLRTDRADPKHTQAPTRNSVMYELLLRRLGSTSSYRVDYELLADTSRFDLGEVSQPFKFLERDPRHAVTFDREQRTLMAHEGSVPEEQPLLSLVAGPFGDPIVIAFREQLTSWSIYHDLPVHQNAAIRQAAVARLEPRVASDGQNLIPVLHTLYSSDREFKRSIDSAMKAAFGADYEELVFPPAADQQVQLRLRWKSLRTEQSAADLSDGTIRFLLMLAIFCSPRAGDVIAVDEPEVGLHPSMLPIVAEFATEAAGRSQVILTTHSPQFLDAFGPNAPVTTVAQWTEGQTRLSVLDPEELKRWLQEYSLGSLLKSGELENLA